MQRLLMLGHGVALVTIIGCSSAQTTNNQQVRDLQAVTSPRVDKNTTPALSEVEAKKLLHAPDRSTLRGLRDHAMLFAFFKTASRCRLTRYQSR